MELKLHLALSISVDAHIIIFIVIVIVLSVDGLLHTYNHIQVQPLCILLDITVYKTHHTFK